MATTFARRRVRQMLDRLDDFVVPQSALYGPPRARGPEPDEDTRCDLCGRRSDRRTCADCRDVTATRQPVEPLPIEPED